MDNCIGCGKCCKKHWLLKLSSDRERKMFKKQLVYGTYIWTDECKFQDSEGKCTIHNEHQPFKCKEFFCEGNLK